MHARLLSGTEAASALLAKLKPEVEKLNPKLVVVQVGEDPASSSYIRQKIKSCKEVGMRSEHKHLPATTLLPELMEVIDTLNNDNDVTGFIVQLPLPSHLSKDPQKIIDAIDPKKDIDGFSTINIGSTFLSKASELLPPATPAGIVALLEHYKIEVAGKHVVVVGRSNIVGKPIAIMLINRGATVTVCNSKTSDLPAITRQADILIAAVGKPKIITADMVKDGVVVIDVGVNRVDGKLIGDCDFEAISKKASAITPVPGGVGPMTVASLIANSVRAKKYDSE